jgi:hypothetical protein
MIKPVAMLLALTGAALLGSCAQQAAPRGASARGVGQCFLASRVKGFGHATDASVDVQVGANRYYRLGLLGPCNDINWSTRLVLRTLTGASDWICDGADAEIIVPGRIGGRCLVTAVHPIGREQWNAR